MVSDRGEYRATGLSRRVLLKGTTVLLAVLAGCSQWLGGSPDGSPSTSRDPRSAREEGSVTRHGPDTAPRVVQVDPAEGGDGIQSAIDRASPGGCVTLQPGTYAVTSPILLTDDIWLRGNHSRLRATSEVPAVIDTPSDGGIVSGARIENVDIDTGGVAVRAVRLTDVTNAIIRGLSVSSNPPIGVEMRGTSEGGNAFNTFENPRIEAHRPLLFDGHSNGAGLVSTVTVLNPHLKVTGSGGIGCHMRGGVGELTFVGGDISTDDRAPEQEAFRAETSSDGHVVQDVTVLNTHVEFELNSGSYVFRSVDSGGTQRDFHFAPGNTIADRSDLHGVDTFGHLLGGEITASEGFDATRYPGRGLRVRDATTDERYLIRVNDGEVEAKGPL